MTYELMEHCNKEIQELLDKKLIRPSKSPWSCAAFYVNKFERGTPRLVINYKPLNTAFTTPFCHYEWNVMPFNLKNAPSEFQNIMNDIFNPFSSLTIVYIDDILIFLNYIEQPLYTFYKIVQTNDLELSKTKLQLLITHNHYIPIQISMLFTEKFPNVIINKKQLLTSYLLFSIVYNNSIFPNLMQTRDIKILHLKNFFQECKKLHPFPNSLLCILDAITVYYQTLTKREKRNLTSQLLKGDETIDKHLQTLYALEKILLCEGIKFYAHENILCANNLMHNLPKPLYNYD
ncbi:RVT_1 domain-containing protein [Cephalotus follicularis]|uniref:RVT_1 domain-containing protein n=1 Tax=Cephalotus follicularis TaxID=3775 RepID=A0A1Q3CNE3_CEPFO|nr:RVT_1 domain-containing protein [Cephalotus follicularis]